MSDEENRKIKQSLEKMNASLISMSRLLTPDEIEEYSENIRHIKLIEAGEAREEEKNYANEVDEMEQYSQIQNKRIKELEKQNAELKEDNKKLMEFIDKQGLEIQDIRMKYDPAYNCNLEFTPPVRDKHSD